MYYLCNPFSEEKGKIEKQEEQELKVFGERNNEK